MTNVNNSSKESKKIFNLAKNNYLSNSLNINSYKEKEKISKTKNINRSIKPFNKIEKASKNFEKIVYKYFKNKYHHTKDFYNIRAIDDIINNYNSHLVSEFKDYLLMGDISEFLQKNYDINESMQFLILLINYYKNSSLIFPNYVLLPEKKYIFKNIRKKQKIINKQQEQIIKEGNSDKNNAKNKDNNNTFFNTITLNSIFNQTNSSNLKLFFDINKNSEKNSDSDIKKICKNIEKNEIKIKHKKYIIKRKNLESEINKDKNNSKMNSININREGENSHKLNKKKFKDNKNIIPKSNVNKILKTEQNNLKKIHKIKGLDKYNSINKKLSINDNNINSNKISKLKLKIGHTKTNTSIFETNTNIYLYKKKSSKNKNNSKTNIFQKVIKFKLKKKKVKNDVKENIMSLLKSKLRNKSTIFPENSSLNSLTKNRRLIINTRRHKKNESLTPRFNINNPNNFKDNKLSISLKVNESSSTPNIYNLSTIRLIKTKENQKIKAKKICKTKNSKIKKISPIDNFFGKFDTVNVINTINSINNKNRKNILQNSNDSLKKYFEKNLFKNKSNLVKYKKYIITTNRIHYQSNAPKYILTYNSKNEISSSNNTLGINSTLKNNNNISFRSIPIFKKVKPIIKRKRNSEIDKNVNINININSNNIFNNLNNSKNIVINNNKSNVTLNNNNLSKKNIYSLLRQQSSSFVFKKLLSPKGIKKLLFSSISNYNIYNNSKKIYSIINKNKCTNLNTNANDSAILSRCMTCRNSNDISKITKKIKKIRNNVKIGSKTNIHRDYFKKEIFNS